MPSPRRREEEETPLRVKRVQEAIKAEASLVIT